MNELLNYKLIKKAIEFLNSKKQATIVEIAQELHVSSSQLQQLFIDFAGVSPEAFFEYISVHYAKQIIGNSNPTLFEPIYTNNISRKIIINESVIAIEEMSPNEIGEKLAINYSFSETKFGNVLIATTHKGICYLVFSDDDQQAISEMMIRFPKAIFTEQRNEMQQKGLRFFTSDGNPLEKIKLHLKGTDFQLKVWNALLKIPMGKLTTYGSLAKTIQQPKAARAVGTAIGSNPIALLMPCHRVIQSSGVYGGYMWGSSRKTAIIGWEFAEMNK